MRDVQQVPDHAARRAFWAGAWPAHGEGNIRVAARAEVEDVLGAAYRSERTLHGRVLQPDGDRPLLRDTGQVAEHVVFLDGQETRHERLVVLGETLHEFIQRDVYESLWNQRLVGDLLGFDLPSHHARQDDGFAGHVEAREVVAGVRLGVVEIYSLPHRLGEGPAALDRAHDETESATRARLYLQYLISRLKEALHG